MSRHLTIYHAGLAPYQQALRTQESLLNARHHSLTGDSLLLLEHPPVITLGRSAQAEHVLAPIPQLEADGIQVERTNRGGDVTLHAPGQLVGYPIIDLRSRDRDIHAVLRGVEETLIHTLRHWSLTATRISGLTGVWVDDRKIAAIGMHFRHWISMHGFALNVNNDLNLFRWIVPCGLHDRTVTSLSQETGLPLTVQAVKQPLIQAFTEVFGYSTVTEIHAPPSEVHQSDS